MVVPDPAIWAASGVDVRGLGLDPRSNPAEADLLVVPERVPEELVAAIAGLRCGLPNPAARRVLPGAPLGGSSAAHLDGSGEIPEEHEERRDGGDGDHSEDDGDEDMMAVTGEPSADGLIMEQARAVVGPLGAALPTGLILELELDGDVVSEAQISSALSIPAADEGPADPLAAQSYEWALARRVGAEPLEPATVVLHLMATELERALSHVMWLARFAGLLGWLDLTERLWAGAAPLIGWRSAPRESLSEIDAAATEPLADCLASLLDGKRLAGRTRGLATVESGTCAELGIGGPIGRAGGGQEDLRSGDAAYRALEFSPVGRERGDAEARCLLRAEEALAALRLANAAQRAGELPHENGPVEGPRGPVAAPPIDGARPPVAGDSAAVEATRALAARSAVGRELAPALAAVASFDLSPWGAIL